MPRYVDNPAAPAIVARVHEYVRTERLWEPGACLLLAVSGGPDSVVLLHLLQTAMQGSVHLAVAHVHHGLRADADADAAFVERVAATYHLPFLLRRVSVLDRVAETGESVEEAARELRYRALREMAAESGSDRIVTGHTADDQAETVLMRVLRGAGMAGLAGIPPRRGDIVRPLLCVWREEIMAYLRAYQLDYRTDLTNYSTDFTRNRIRLELLPLLEEQYAPRLRTRLRHLAELARQDNDVLDAWATREYACLRERGADGIVLPDHADLPRAVTWRLWRLAIAEVRGGLANIGYDHLEDIACLPHGQQVHLPGVRVLHENDQLLFRPVLPEGEEPHVILPQRLPVPGRICLLDGECCLRAECVPAPSRMERGNTALLDADAVRGELTVRSWRPGDRYRPFGAPGSRKLQDIFVDAGVPRRLRERVPVVLDEDGIVWLAGFRLADRVKMMPATTRSLRLSIEWELNPWTLMPSKHA